MGMAASQARLLMLTSRLHDVELKAQQLQNAKLQLSTQQDAVYEDYQKALDATTFTANFINRTTGAKTDLPVTFNNLFSVGATSGDQSLSNYKNYILIDSRGRVVVDDEIAEAYDNYQSFWLSPGEQPFAVSYDNAYMFAWYMIEGQQHGHWAGGGDNNPSALMTAIEEVYANHTDELGTLINNAIANLNEAYGHQWEWANGNGIDTYNPPLSVILAAIQCDLSAGYTDTQKEAFDDLTNFFWGHYAQEVFNKLDEGAANNNGDEYNKFEFDYYVRIYNAIQQHGGCISIEAFNGQDGSAANNNEWLTAMLQSGQMSLEIVEMDNQGNATITGASVASEESLGYTATTQIDKVAMAKAEAEYEHEMKIIDRKEQKIDLELNKIETERTAITKEYDSIKKVSEENIDRTFGIFS